MKTKLTTLSLESSPVVCERCRRPFEHFVFDQIGEFTLLRCGSLLVQRVEAKCSCGYVFHWNLPEKKIEKILALLEKAIAALDGGL